MTKQLAQTAAWASALLPMLFLGACQPSPEELYLRMEQREKASGVRHDSLFAGLYLGMARSEFRAFSLDMHKARKFREGGLKSGSWVEYALPVELSYPGAINFYPEFRKDRITEMRAAVYYDPGLSFSTHPFDKKELLNDVLNLLRRWHGAEFIRIPSTDRFKDDIYVNVMGNRRITVYNDGDHFSISLWYVDLDG